MRNFRSFSDRTVDFDDATTILVGPQMPQVRPIPRGIADAYGGGYSFQTSPRGQLINDKSDEARDKPFALKVMGASYRHDVRQLSSGKRRTTAREEMSGNGDAW